MNPRANRSTVGTPDGVTKTYSYATGSGAFTNDLTGITYSDGTTANVTYSNYDRLGRPGAVGTSDGLGNRTLTYAHGTATGEAYTAGALSGFALARGLDGVYRVGNVTLALGGTGVYAANLTWNGSTGRLDGVTAGSDTANYTYVANSNLAGNVTLAHGGTAALTREPAYDFWNRQTAAANVYTAGNDTLAYAYNNRGQRTSATNAAGDAWAYGYDSDGNTTAVGQLTSAVKTLAANSTVLANYTYAYDSIGNRLSAGVGGIVTGNATAILTGNYYNGTTGNGTTGANLLNQYGSRDVGRSLGLVGTAAVNATVTVNGANATRVGSYWYGQLSYAGNNSAQWAAVDVLGNLTGNYAGGVAKAEQTGHLLLKANPEVFAYDADGNLLADGRWSYGWDAEDRLTTMITGNAAVAAGMPKEKLVFGYDDQGRKLTRKVYAWDSGNSTWKGTPDVSVGYLYDGWNLLAEVNLLPATPAVVRDYYWGLDVSGSAQGAGGVGGLLMGDLTNAAGTKQRVYYGYNSNGDVIDLVDTGGNLAAHYEYDPYGKVIGATGVLASYNPVRFSTKYADTDALSGGRDAGLYYYGMRFLGEGRFLTRDPLGEAGCVNVYDAGDNDLINHIDAHGEFSLGPILSPPGGALIEYAEKAAFYSSARLAFTKPHWIQMFDDWYNENGPDTFTANGYSDPRNYDIANNAGFQKMLGCYVSMLMNTTLKPTGNLNGSWIDTSKKQFFWHFTIPFSNSPGGDAAYADETYFLGSYLVTVDDHGSGKYGITVNNTTGWTSATAIPRTGHQVDVWPDHPRRQGTGTPLLPSHGGSWPQVYTFEVSAKCSSCTFP